MKTLSVEEQFCLSSVFVKKKVIVLQFLKNNMVSNYPKEEKMKKRDAHILLELSGKKQPIHKKNKCFHAL